MQQIKNHDKFNQIVFIYFFMQDTVNKGQIIEKIHQNQSWFQQRMFQGFQDFLEYVTF